MAFLLVKPTDEVIKSSQIALWEQDADDHSKADPKWGPDGYNGAYIAGDPKNPEATYKVADTPGVRQAVKSDRLIIVKSNISVDSPVKEPDEKKDK